MARGKPNPAAVAPPPVAKVAGDPPRLDDDATWAAELSAAFTRLQADVRQRAHSVLGGELARMLGASGAVTAALGRPEAPAMAPEPRGEPVPGRAARAAPAPTPPRPSPADDALAAEPDAAPAATARSARGPKPAPEAPAPLTAVLRRRAGKPVTGDTPLASPVTDPTASPAAQLTLAGLAPEPEMSDGDDADADLADAVQDEALDAAPDAPQDDAQRERERRRDERREARMQRRQWRQERARQRRADARMRQAAKATGNGPATALPLGMWSPDAPAYRADAAMPEPSAPAREGSRAADPDEHAPAAQAELALASDASAPLEPDEVEPAQATDGRKRIRWTRETIITELASFLVSGTVIDASFIERYGPPGLVAATRRVFGRFDAALNVAGLHVAKLYPDGPPAR